MNIDIANLHVLSDIRQALVEEAECHWVRVTQHNMLVAMQNIRGNLYPAVDLPGLIHENEMVIQCLDLYYYKLIKNLKKET